MKYLFLDLEASNMRRQASICSVGYILTDESFNIIKEAEILVNPKLPYVMPPNFQLNVNKQQLRHQPSFRKIYDQLQELFTDTLIIGHGIECDVVRLIASCKRYHLPIFNFSFICTQVIFGAVSKEYSARISLSALAQTCSFTFTPHNALEDARAVLAYLKSLTNKLQLNLPDIITKYHIEPGLCADQMIPCLCLDEEIFRMRQRLNSKSIIEIKSKSINTLITSGRHFIKTDSIQQSFAKKVITFNPDLEQRENINEIILALFLLGGIYSKNSKEADIYIASGSPNDRRQKNIKKAQIISESAFLEMIAVYFPIINQAFNLDVATV